MVVWEALGSSVSPWKPLDIGRRGLGYPIVPLCVPSEDQKVQCALSNTALIPATLPCPSLVASPQKYLGPGFARMVRSTEGASDSGTTPAQSSELRAKSTETLRSRSALTAHGPDPLQSPPQLLKAEPASACAANSTLVPLCTVMVQVPG